MIIKQFNQIVVVFVLWILFSFQLLVTFSLQAEEKTRFGINWINYNDHPVRQVLEKALEIDMDDAKMIWEHFHNIPVTLQEYGWKFPQYSTAKNEFERKRIQQQLQERLDKHVDSLLNAANLVVKKNITFSEYSFEQKGFPLLPDNRGARENQGWGVVYDQSFQNSVFGLCFVKKENAKDIFPNYFPMSEDSAEQFIKTYPMRSFKAFILFQPIKNGNCWWGSGSENINCVPNYLIVVTPIGRVLGAFECGSSVSLQETVHSKPNANQLPQKTPYNIFYDLTKDLPDNNWFYERNKIFNEPFQKVWDIVNTIVLDIEEPITNSDSINGIILTGFAKHMTHMSRVAILVQNTAQNKTTVFVKGFYYFSEFDTRTSKLIWVRNNMQDGYSEKILNRIEKELK